MENFRQSSKDTIYQLRNRKCQHFTMCGHDLYARYFISNLFMPLQEQHGCKPAAKLYSVLGIVSEYDQEIPQSQTADSPMAQRGRAIQPSQATRKTN